VLAFVFWHRPRAGVDSGDYEAALLRYHDRLAEEALEGVHGSAVYALADVPWLGAPGYEDWYFVEASFALDTLNAGAVSGPLRELHDAVAALTGPMAGGLYRLHEERCAGGAVWRRQMVLGPVSELCRPGAARLLRAGP
jgi:hypothetical protein